MFNKFLVIAVLFNVNIFAQVSINPGAIEFPQVFTSSADSAAFYLINNNYHSVTVELSNLKPVYTLSDTVLIIQAMDSTIVWIKYSPDQNVIDADVVIITSSDSTIGAVIDVNGIAKYGDNYDATTFNKFDNELKSVLTSLVNNHTSLGYTLARDKMFMEFDNQRVNGQGATQNTLECVYTGRLAVGYTSRTVAQNPPYNFNTEHTWPQSNFNEAEPMKSDLYHLYPTDITANSIRANYPFGKAVTNVTWQVGGSKLGFNNLGQQVFEPRDVHKGDVSRSMFYFITRYPVNYGGFFTQIQENVFREWNKFDTVGVVESNRNNAIALLQLKRNPYIDHPEFVDRIYSFAASNTRPTYAELKVLPLKVEFDSTNISEFTTQQVYIANSGTAQLNIDSITISDSRFSLSLNSNSIESYSSKKALLKFQPDSLMTYNALLKVYTNGGVKEIVLTGIGNDNTVNVEDEIFTPLLLTLEQNYPNPFNPSTTIQYAISNKQFVILKVYDLIGKEIATLVNEYKPAGSYEVEFSANSGPASSIKNLASGIYFYRLQAGDYVISKKMTLLK